MLKLKRVLKVEKSQQSAHRLRHGIPRGPGKADWLQLGTYIHELKGTQPQSLTFLSVVYIFLKNDFSSYDIPIEYILTRRQMLGRKAANHMRISEILQQIHKKKGCTKFFILFVSYNNLYLHTDKCILAYIQIITIQKIITKRKQGRRRKYFLFCHFRRFNVYHFNIQK